MAASKEEMQKFWEEESGESGSTIKVSSPEEQAIQNVEVSLKNFYKIFKTSAEKQKRIENLIFNNLD